MKASDVPIPPGGHELTGVEKWVHPGLKFIFSP